MSVIAGLFVAYATAALLVLAGWAVAVWMAVNANMSPTGWRRVGQIGGLGAAVVLLVAFAYGGYSSGRMARRGGLRNGLLVAMLGICLAVGIAFAAGGLGAWGAITREVHRLGAPTTWDEWRSSAFIAGIASLVAVIAGGLIGGRLGERWHLKLVTRARDPLVSGRAHVSGMSERRLRQEPTSQDLTPEEPTSGEPVLSEEPVRQEVEHPASAGGE